MPPRRLGAGAGRIILDLLPLGLALQQGNLGSLGFEDRTNRGMEDLARVIAVEAPEAIENAGDEELGRGRGAPREQTARLEETPGLSSRISTGDQFRPVQRHPSSSAVRPDRTTPPSVVETQNCTDVGICPSGTPYSHKG
jgi:hypothetical protein